MSSDMGRKADHYRDKAEESRTKAECATDEKSRELLFDIAEQYEELARKAEGRGD